MAKNRNTILKFSVMIYTKAFFIFVLIINGALSADYYTEKPEFISRTCRFASSDFKECSLELIQSLFTHLFGVGIAEVTEEFGLLDPLKFDTVEYSANDNEAVQLNATFKDPVVHGFSKMKFTEFEILKKKLTMSGKVFIPEVLGEGHYKFDGKIFGLPMHGSGKFFLNIYKTNFSAQMKLKLYEKDGLQFFNVTKIRMQLAIGNTKSHYDNLFSEDAQEVEDTVNEIMNVFWRSLFEAQYSEITKALSTIFGKILRKAFEVIPVKYLFEDIARS